MRQRGYLGRGPTIKEFLAFRLPFLFPLSYQFWISFHYGIRIDEEVVRTLHRSSQLRARRGCHQPQLDAFVLELYSIAFYCHLNKMKEIFAKIGDSHNRQCTSLNVVCRDLTYIRPGATQLRAISQTYFWHTVRRPDEGRSATKTQSSDLLVSV